MTTSFRTLSAVLLVAVLTAVGADPAEASHPLHPGDYMEAGDSACTLGFVFDGQDANAGKTYFSTAAHCVTAPGQDVADIHGVVFGDVAFMGSEATTQADYAFIEVRAGHVGRVAASVKGHPSYPTGFTTPTETAVGDQVQLSGYGIGYSLTQPTREERRALMSNDDTGRWTVIGPLINGDSGGPLVHIPTGKALGLESRVCIHVCTDEGPTVQGILSRAQTAGFPVSLRTV